MQLNQLAKSNFKISKKISVAKLVIKAKAKYDTIRLYEKFAIMLKKSQKFQFLYR